MTGKAYYITTLADWQRYAARFANSHFIVLAAPAPTSNVVIPREPAVFAGDEGSAVALRAPHEETAQQIPRTPSRAPTNQANDEIARDSARNDNAGPPVEGRDFSPAENEVRAAPSSLVGQRFLALSEVEGSSDINDGRAAPSLLPQAVAQAAPERHDSSVSVNRDAATRTSPEAVEDSRRILVLIEADEGVHLSLDDDPAFELLPHPLAQKPISAAAQSALAPHGVPPGATTFDAAEALARVHPLLRHRVF